MDGGIEPCNPETDNSNVFKRWQSPRDEGNEHRKRMCYHSGSKDPGEMLSNGRSL